MVNVHVIAPVMNIQANIMNYRKIEKTKKSIISFQKGVEVMVFTPHEKTILDYFFTSSDEKDTVYAAKETLPDVITGYLIGRASRAKETFREIFLKMWEEATNSAVCGDGILAGYQHRSEAQKTIHDHLKFLRSKSVGFLGKWKLHNSLRDVPHIAIFCDDLSILQTKVWEHEPVAEYQEKSTRYRPFVATNVFLPNVNDVILNELKEGQEKLIEVYNAIHEETKKRDLARYLLPVGSRTAMGCMASIRSWERIVGRMLEYPTEESRQLGSRIREHICKLVSIFEPSEDVEDFSFLNKLPDWCYDEQPQQANITKMPDHDVYHIGGLIDIGAHRDLQRHRSVIQNFIDYRACFGYDVLLGEFINKDLYSQYVECMKKFNGIFWDTFQALKNTNNVGECQYVSVLGHMTRFSYITDKNRWQYIYNLRTGNPCQKSTNEKTVHFSYSNWCKLAQKNMDSLQN